MGSFLFYSLLFSFVLGATIGRFYTHFLPSLLFLPTWLFIGILSSLTTFILSFGFILLLSGYIKSNFALLVSINIALSEALIILMIRQTVTNK